MAHFARIENNQVQEVIVIDNSQLDNKPFPESEPLGQAFISQLGIAGQWLQTSYNNNFRGRYAGIGMLYRDDLDAFIHTQPYPSWQLDSNYEWQAPVACENSDQLMEWNELAQQWQAI